MRTTLQIPMDHTLKELATKSAKTQGFSSLQEAVRVILKKFAAGTLTVRISEETEYIILSQAAKRRYQQIDKDIKNGVHVTTTKNLEELFKLLES